MAVDVAVASCSWCCFSCSCSCSSSSSRLAVVVAVLLSPFASSVHKPPRNRRCLDAAALDAAAQAGVGKVGLQTVPDPDLRPTTSSSWHRGPRKHRLAALTMAACGSHFNTARTSDAMFRCSSVNRDLQTFSYGPASRLAERSQVSCVFKGAAGFGFQPRAFLSVQASSGGSHGLDTSF